MLKIKGTKKDIKEAIELLLQYCEMANIKTLKELLASK